MIARFGVRALSIGLVGALALYPLACGDSSTSASSNATAGAGGSAAGAGNGGAAHGLAGTAGQPSGGAAGGNPDASTGGTPGSMAGAPGGGESGTGEAEGGDAAGGTAGQGGAGDDAAGAGGAAGAGPTPGPVAVTVRLPDAAGTLQPAVGRNIVFTDTRGTSVVSTDAQGKATFDVLPGATVTLVGYESAADLVSTLGVQPGDDLVYDATPGCGTSASMTIVWPVFSGASAYELHVLGTSSSTPGTSLEVLVSGCSGASTDLLVLALDAQGKPLGYLAKHAAPVLDGVTEKLSAGTWASIGSYSVAYTGIPQNASLEASAGLGSRQYPLQLTSAGIPYTGATNSTSLPLAGFGDPVNLSTQVSLGGAPFQNIYDSFARASSASINIGANLLPWIASPTVDLTTRTVAWTTQAAGSVVPSGTVLWLQLTGAGGPRGWTIIAPATSSSLKLPEFPASLSTYGPQSGDTVQAYPQLLQSSDYADFTALRRANLASVLRALDGFGTASLVRVSVARGLP